jgi:isoquinoline 1-oxidoreductase alpha subunit
LFRPSNIAQSLSHIASQGTSTLTFPQDFIPLEITVHASYNLPRSTLLALASNSGWGSSMTRFFVNGKPVQVDVDPSTPLLWVLRESLALTGTKFGCGMALCGACTVHLDGKAIRSCVAPVSRAEGRHITTIEGLSANLTHPLQKAWIELDVPQCGYCQSGQIMSAAVLLAENMKPSDEDIDEAMGGNICRCGTYPRIRKAIHRAAELASERGPK